MMLVHQWAVFSRHEPSGRQLNRSFRDRHHRHWHSFAYCGAQDGDGQPISKGSLKMRKFTLVDITATMASLFAQTNTATSRTTASADPEGLSSMPSSILSFLLDTLIALF